MGNESFGPPARDVGLGSGTDPPGQDIGLGAGIDLPGQNIGLGAAADPWPARDGGGHDSTPAPDEPGGAPSWRALGLLAMGVGALVAVFALGQVSGRNPAPDPPPRAPTAAPTSIPDPVSAPVIAAPAPTVPEPPPAPGVEELLGEGAVLAEIDFGNRSRAVIWCRENVPGTSIGSTLALLYFGDSIRFGEQLIRYEELTRPWMPSGAGRRGVVLETEGLGAGDFPSTAPNDDEAEPLPGSPDGSRCESCAPTLIELDGSDALIGSCVHGVPLRAGIAYAIMAPTAAGQTPLALHIGCGVTTIRHEGDQLVIEAEAPLLPGLHDARFHLPPMTVVRESGRFRAHDLELLDWHCDIERSSQLGDLHLVRTDPARRMSYETIDSLIGEVGVRGPVAIGLSTDQCRQFTRAWWGRPGAELGAGTPIADLLGIEPPPGHDDWYYACQPR